MTDVPPEHIEPVKRLADAAHVLIGIVRKAEYSERSHLHAAELCLDIDLTGGGTEKWLIRVERVARPVHSRMPERGGAGSGMCQPSRRGMGMTRAVGGFQASDR